MEPKDPNYKEVAATIFQQAPFVTELGIVPVEITPGFVESRLKVEARHQQHDQVVHAGVQATMADHTAGAAGYTLLAPDQMVLTTSFTIHLLQVARGEELRCRARVLRAGRRLVVVESEVFAVSGGEEQLVSKAVVSLAAMEKRR